MEPIAYQTLQELDDYFAEAKRQNMSQQGTCSDGFSIGSAIVRNKIQSAKIFFVYSEMYDELLAAIELLDESVRRGFLLNPNNPKSWITSKFDFDSLRIYSEASKFIWDYLGSVRSVVHAVQVDYKDTVQKFRKQTRQLLINNAIHATSTVMTVRLGSYYDGSTSDIFNGEFEADFLMQPNRIVSAEVYKVWNQSKGLFKKEKTRNLWGKFEIDGNFISGKIEYLYFTRSIMF